MIRDSLNQCWTCRGRRLSPAPWDLAGWVISCRCDAVRLDGRMGGPGDGTRPVPGLRPQAAMSTFAWRTQLLIEEASVSWLPQRLLASPRMRPCRA